MRRVVVGLAVALSVGAYVAILTPVPSRAGPQCVFHVHRGVSDSLLVSYDDLLGGLPTDVQIVAAVSSASDERLIRTRYADTPRLRILRVPSALSPWARDRYVLFERDGRRMCLTLPYGCVLPHARGDLEVPQRLFELDTSLWVIRTPYSPIGGDTIVTPRAVLVGTTALADVAARVTESEGRIRQEFETLFGRPVVIVRSSQTAFPHIDTVIADAGDNRLLVTDPRLLHVPASSELERFGPASLFDLAYNRDTAAALDRIAEQLRACGFDVERIPGLFAARPIPGQTHPTALTYTNTLVLGNRVFVPAYGVTVLDREARAVWRRLGYDVVPVRTASAALNGGAIRCLTNAFAQ